MLFLVMPNSIVDRKQGDEALRGWRDMSFSVVALLAVMQVHRP